MISTRSIVAVGESTFARTLLLGEWRMVVVRGKAAADVYLHTSLVPVSIEDFGLVVLTFARKALAAEWTMVVVSRKTLDVYLGKLLV